MKRSLLQIIKDAEKQRVAIGHFNISNLEQLAAVAYVARRLNTPVIIGVSEGERDYVGLGRVKDLVASYNSECVPESMCRLYLNADHTHDPGKVREAARIGFDAVLFDGGRLPLEKNIELTRTAAKLARTVNHHVLVEGELGYIGSGSEIFKELPKDVALRPEDLTKPEDAARFVKETGVDLLAPAVGNVHGIIQSGNPRLDIARIKAIREAAGVPLVLHGGSGISDEDFIAAIDAGISVVHISTELRAAWRKGMEETLKNHSDEISPYKLMPGVLVEIERVVEGRLKLFTRL